MSSKITLEHFENGVITFDDSNKFMEFVQAIYNENESGEECTHCSYVPKPMTSEDAKNYINIYCDNFKIIE